MDKQYWVSHFEDLISKLEHSQTGGNNHWHFTYILSLRWYISMVVKNDLDARLEGRLREVENQVTSYLASIAWASTSGALF